jgi:polar amino acid transport system substrate-binding protein
MSKSLAVLLLSVLVSAFTPGSAGAQVLDRVVKNRELRVATSGSQPPFNAVSREGELIGLEVDLARMLAEAMNVNLNLASMPFPDLLPALEAGKVDMVLSGLAITPERAQRFAWVGPYVLSGKSVLTDGQTLVRMKTPRDLDKAELTLVTLRDSTSQDYAIRVAPSAKIVALSSYDEAIRMILENKADAMIADMPVCIITVMKNPTKDLATPSVPFNVEPIGIALPAGDERLFNLIQTYLEAFEKTGRLEELRTKWLERSDWLALLP